MAETSATGPKVYGVLPGASMGRGAMSVPQLARSLALYAQSNSHLPLRLLASFHYVKNLDLDALFAEHFTPPYPDLFLDCGAYTARLKGSEIDLVEYAEYVRRYRHVLTVYSNLDVIGNAQATWENQQRLEDMGLSPLPVFHAGSSWNVLERYLDRYSYIALGGLVGRIVGAMPWLVRAFKLAQGRAVYHGFGVTSWPVLRDLPWYSVDSSTWAQGFRYASIWLFDSRRGRFCSLDLGDGAAWSRHASLVRSLGFDPADFADRERNDWSKICAISALSYMLAERWLRDRHGEIEIPSRARAALLQEAS